MPDEITTIEVGGKQYTVTKQFAEALAEKEKGAQETFEKPDKEPGDENLQHKSAEKEPARDKKGQWLPSYVEDPDKFLETVETQVAERLTKKQKEKADAEKREKELWDKFYEKNKHLKKFDFLVKSVAQRDYEEHLKPLADGNKQDEFFDKLAELANEEFMRIKGEANDEPKKTFVEGGPGPIVGEGETESADDNKVKSLGDIIKQRAEKREKARTQAA